jgi:ATP-binding cassette, subfamily B, bacterial
MAKMRPLRPDENAPPPTLRQRLGAMRNIPPLLRLIWETHPGFTVGIIIIRFVRAFVPVASLWVGKLIIDRVVAMAGSGADAGPLWKLVALEIGIVVVGELLARASALMESLLGDLFTNVASVRLMRHAATLDLYQFENPEFYDKLERARRGTTGRIALLSQILSMAQDIITIAMLGAALLIFSPWLVLLLALSVVPNFLGETHFANLSYSLLFRWTPERRQLDYLRYIGASNESAKEVQVFGLAPWFIERYRVLSDRFYEENRKLAIRRAFVSTGLSFVGTIGYYAAYVIMLLQTIEGAITVGSLTFLAGSFARSRDLMGRILSGASDVYQQSLFLKDLFEFFEMKPTIASVPGAPEVPRTIREGFVFESVGFRYPGSDRWAIRNVSFVLRPGERIALVGENGAGKTTLSKLIARLYDPSEGRILLDGRDLREYDLASVRRSVGVIFQDFFRYDFPFDENIAVGEIERVRDEYDPSIVETDGAPTVEMPVPEAVIVAAERSLASSLLPRLPKGYRQMLGRRFEGGVNLSGGEWQKVALARAYMRESHVLILDEPTAALDARAEYEVFVRFAQLVAGRMAVIISHRFSTVRMADRIIVMSGGDVVEEGSHDELIARAGLYAELFHLQAEGYR